MQEVLIRGIDFESTDEIHEYIAEELMFPSYYGRNLDALYDVLTGLPHRGTRFVLVMPTEDSPSEVRIYAEKILSVFQEAGKGDAI